MKPLITKAPKKAISTTKPVTPPPAANTTPAKPAAVKATAAKPKLVSRPKPKPTAKPAPKPIDTPLLGPPVFATSPVPTATPAPTVAYTNGPLHQIPPESPAPAPMELIEPVIQSKPLIITIPPESPAPPAEAAILTSSGDKKASGYAVVESEVTPPATDAKVSSGYVVVESDSQPPTIAPAESEATGLPLVAPAPAESKTTGIPLAAPPPGTPSDAAKPANYLVVESEIKPQVVDDAAVPGGYTVIESETADAKKPGYTVIESDSEPGAKATSESDATGLPLISESSSIGLPLSDAVPPPAPSIPTVTIPPSHALEDVSSIQIGDVLIIAVKVMPKAEPEMEP
ncbi:hypothetical protein [Armatimonas sp.]|uniref:hypothetical protein n=1 Tax=Armatimonas sp. TaxID=1872638 RepID=UPI00286D061D|nr:hypothetical protein [Armatimonas sp.]